MHERIIVIFGVLQLEVDFKMYIYFKDTLICTSHAESQHLGLSEAQTYPSTSLRFSKVKG